MPFRRVDLVLPGRFQGRHMAQLRTIHPVGKALTDELEGRRDLFRVGTDQIGGIGHLRQRIVRVRHGRQHAHIFGVVGHRDKIERRTGQAHIEARRMADRFALGIAVGIIGCCTHVEDKRIERVFRMDVQIAEKRLPVRIEIRRLGLDRFAGPCADQGQTHRQRSNAAHQSRPSDASCHDPPLPLGRAFPRLMRMSAAAAPHPARASLSAEIVRRLRTQNRRIPPKLMLKCRADNN